MHGGGGGSRVDFSRIWIRIGSNTGRKHRGVVLINKKYNYFRIDNEELGGKAVQASPDPDIIVRNMSTFITNNT